MSCQSTREFKVHVLQVEDRSIYSNRWSRLLKHLGHTLALATNYDDAVSEFLSKQPDLIICDNDLADCATYSDGLDNGYFFITKIRKEGFVGHIIFYTSNPQSYFEGELNIEALNVRFIRKRYKRTMT